MTLTRGDASDYARLLSETGTLVTTFDAILAGASIFASGSRAEGLPMVMVEALSKGLPLVSFDCPRGPGDLIEDGYNARLVPDGHIDGLTDALRQLVQDDEARFLMGRNALASAHPYTIDRIAERWEQLFEELLDRRRHSPGVSK